MGTLAQTVAVSAKHIHVICKHMRQTRNMELLIIFPGAKAVVPREFTLGPDP